VQDTTGLAAAPGLGTCEVPLVQRYDGALLDLDGVLYLGAEPVPHASTVLAQAREAGMRLAFVTNNASRRADVVAAHLTELGIPAEPDDVVTSAQAAARYLAERLAPGTAVLVVGTEGLAEEIEAVGLHPVRKAAGAQAVVQGLAPTTSWQDLAEAALALHAGALWVAGNRDATYPTEQGPVPGNGAFVAALEVATGRSPHVVGKPEPELHRASVERVQATRPLVVGDRLDTDVLGARRNGTDSLLVLTGVTTLDDLLAAEPEQRPTYVAHDLRGLLASHPPVHREAERAWCGDASAWWESGVLRQDGPPDHALRAACALAWEAGPSDRS
jgi:HAD superfamily hydrolase (TIGR01450 family)